MHEPHLQKGHAGRGGRSSKGKHSAAHQQELPYRSYRCRYTHENEERYRFSFDFDENCHADNSEPRVHATYDFWKGDDEESVEWAVFEVTTDKPFFLLSYEEYESIELTGFYDSFDEAFEKMKELIAESVNDVFDEDATADDVEDMEDYNVFVHSNKDSKDSGAPLAFASFCDDYPNREWTIFHI